MGDSRMNISDVFVSQISDLRLRSLQDFLTLDCWVVLQIPSINIAPLQLRSVTYSVLSLL